MTLEISATNLPDLLAAVGMFALAALLLWVAPHDRLHRAFALVQALNGATSLAFVGWTGYGASDPALAAAITRAGDYYYLSALFATAFFALRLLDPEGRRRASRPLAWALLVAAATVALALASDPSAHRVRAGSGLAYGPIRALYELVLPSFGALALLLAWRASHATSVGHRAGLLLAGLGFVVLAAFWGGHGVVWNATRDPASTAALEGHPLVVFVVLNARIFALLLAVATLVAISVRPLRDDAGTRALRRAFLAVTVAAAATGAGAAALTRAGLVSDLLSSTLDGVLRVGQTILLAYALLRRQLFGKEVKLRFAISRSTVAAAFIAAFFVASEGAQIVFGQAGPAVGLVAAGALVFAMAPLQRAADRLAERAVPIAEQRRADFSAPDRREATYRAAVRYTLRDGLMGRDEELHLARLAADLGLAADRAVEIRHEIEAEAGVT